MDDADEVPAGPPEATGSTTEPTAAPEPGSLGPHPERHPDDLPPSDLVRPRVPAGVLWALALAVVVLTIASFVAFSTESDPTPDDDIARLDPNAAIPLDELDGIDVTGQPVSATPYTTFEGGTTTLADHEGVPMVVNFWASSCLPCVTEMPAFERVHQDVKDQVAFVGLAVNDIEDDARELATQTGVTYELGFDSSGIIRQSGGAVLPTTVFVAADGTILETHVLDLDEDELRQKIEQHFGVTVPAPS